MHLCPTRVDGEPVLFAHMITVPICQQRQRDHYHKCPTCVHSNVLAPIATNSYAAKPALAKLAVPGKLTAG